MLLFLIIIKYFYKLREKNKKKFIRLVEVF